MKCASLASQRIHFKGVLFELKRNFICTTLKLHIFQQNLLQIKSKGAKWIESALDLNEAAKTHKRMTPLRQSVWATIDVIARCVCSRERIHTHARAYTLASIRLNKVDGEEKRKSKRMTHNQRSSRLVRSDRHTHRLRKTTIIMQSVLFTKINCYHSINL